ncbi:YggS family pyridoxal phosphate-dependent enzyme [Okibacterium endophyticum]
MDGTTLAERVDRVRQGVAEAMRSAGRRPDEVTLIAVTKFHPARLVDDLYRLGLRDIGENRHQEAQAKADELRDLADLRWHFVGQLQSKKARQVRRYADAVHSLDRASVVDALDSAGREETGRLDCFVQLNLTDDPARGGVAAADLDPLVERVLGASSLRLLGVMAVAPLGEDPRRAFARVREASERVRALAPHASAISAGMSQDFREAVLEGATHLRIGAAITGKRPDGG